MARGFIPDGLRSSLLRFSLKTSFEILRLLRSRSGMNPLATEGWCQGVSVVKHLEKYFRFTRNLPKAQPIQRSGAHRFPRTVPPD
ncbi:hypothetical protein EMIT0P260_30070 [Pseudomonas sp. IT-P260]